MHLIVKHRVGFANWLVPLLFYLGVELSGERERFGAFGGQEGKAFLALAQSFPDGSTARCLLLEGEAFLVGMWCFARLVGRLQSAGHPMPEPRSAHRPAGLLRL